MSRFYPPIFFIACLAILCAGCGSTLAKNAMTSPGTSTESMRVDRDKRTYRLHIPAGYRHDAPVPLLLVLHGAFSSAKKAERFSGFSNLADEHGFIVAYPNGRGLLGFLRHWNAGFCCGQAMRADWNDTGFLLQLIDDLSGELAVDRKRVYLAGMSNGGMLVHRFAAENPDQVAAITLVAAAAGARWEDAEEMQAPPYPDSPVPALVIHARDDPTIPFEGGLGSRADVEYLGPLDTVAFWRSANRCIQLPAEKKQLPGGDWTRWDNCLGGSEVALLALDQGGHAWPGEHIDDSGEMESESAGSVNASETAWQFMSRFSLP